jgi:hypothetical protein
MSRPGAACVGPARCLVGWSITSARVPHTLGYSPSGIAPPRGWSAITALLQAAGGTPPAAQRAIWNARVSSSGRSCGAASAGMGAGALCRKDWLDPDREALLELGWRGGQDPTLTVPAPPGTTRGGPQPRPPAGRHRPAPLLSCSRNLPCGRERVGRHAGTARPKLSRRYGDVVALDDLSFTVREGQMFGFVAPTAPARPPPCGSSWACWRPTPGRSSGAAARSTSRHAGGPDTCPRTTDKRFLRSALVSQEYERWRLGRGGDPPQGGCLRLLGSTVWVWPPRGCGGSRGHLKPAPVGGHGRREVVLPSDTPVMRAVVVSPARDRSTS